MNIRLKFYNEVAKCLELAIAKYDLDPTIARVVPIKLDIRGRVAGYAGYKSIKGERQYYLRFNIEGIEEHWDYMVNSVIPHEVAHLVAYMREDLNAKSHCRVWKRIDISLGGNGKRCHNLPLTKAKRTTWFTYEVAGTTIELSKVRHNRLQRGRNTYSIKLLTGEHQISALDYTGERCMR